MGEVAFHVIDGVDKGRSFVSHEMPITIGREEGNVIRLNDERISRFHAKVQADQGQVVLTDLDSTNGTTVNGDPIQLRLLRPGDRVGLGRSVLVFGTLEEIAKTVREEEDRKRSKSAATLSDGDGGNIGAGLHTDLSASEVDLYTDDNGRFDVFERTPPRLPGRLTPAQAAQLSEVIDFLHRALSEGLSPVHIPPDAKEARIPLEHWHRVQVVLTFLAQYSRKVSEPDDSFDEPA